MVDDPPLHLKHRFQVITRYLGIITLAIGISVLIGWVFKIDMLKHVFPGLVQMKFNTALGFVFAASALLVLEITPQKQNYIRLARGLALVTMLIGVLTLIEYALRVNLGIDELFFADPVTNPNAFPGRMATPTALCFALIGFALFVLPLARWRYLNQLIALMVGGFGSLAVLGYLYNVSSLYTLYQNNPMALHTAFAFTLLSLAILFIQPDKGFMRLMTNTGAAGLMIRRFLPLVFFVPIVLGWFILQAQYAGLQDAAISLAVFVVLSIAIMGAVTWWNAVHIMQMDEKRLLASHDFGIASAQFKTLFEESLDVIMVLDGQTGTILNVNQVIRRDLGYRPEQIIGKHFSTLFPDQTDQDQDEITRQLRMYGQVFASQDFLRADGGKCPMDLTATIIPWGDERAILATLRDATERKRMEEEIFQGAMLRMEMEKEREVMKLKESFITMVSHDFRTPLSVIMTSNDILERYHERMTEQRRLEQLQTIRQQVQYMNDLLEDVLLLGKARADRLDFSPSPLDVVKVCLSLFEQMQAISQKRHTFVFNRTGNFTDVTLDEKLLKRILSNLLTNAIKYSPDGGEIRLELCREGDKVIFRISDEGIGIPDKDKDKLFEAFHRASNSYQITGTGLGLAIVHETVRVHGGEITFDSVEGEGTTFTVTLPYR